MIADKRKYFIKQKLCGVAMILCGGAVIIISKDTALPAVCVIAIGLWLLCTRNEIMTFEEWSGWDD